MDLWRGPLARAGMRMLKRLVPLVAAIGGFFLAMMLATDAARAEKRVALVVGNSNYQTVPQLPNPSRDANAVAKMFRDAGFDTVDILINVGNLEFKRAIRKFETIADQADIAVVYYAGHGLEIGGINYLIPIDARLASDRDAEDEAIPLERLVSSADGAKRLRLIILDACRDNPFVTVDAPRAQDRHPGGLGGSRQGRADQHRHADRLCREGRLDRRRRRWPAQPVHDGGSEKSHRSRSRCPSRLRAGPRRGDEERPATGRSRSSTVRSAAAISRWCRRRRWRRRRRPATSRRITNWFSRSARSGPGKCFWARTRPASMPILPAPRSRP